MSENDRKVPRWPTDGSEKLVERAYEGVPHTDFGLVGIPVSNPDERARAAHATHDAEEIAREVAPWPKGDADLDEIEARLKAARHGEWRNADGTRPAPGRWGDTYFNADDAMRADFLTPKTRVGIEKFVRELRAARRVAEFYRQIFMATTARNLPSEILTCDPHDLFDAYDAARKP